MPDFPESSVPEAQTPLFLHGWTTWGAGWDLRSMAASAAPVSTTWVANLAIYQPIILPWTYTIRRFFWMNGATLTGPPNADCAIYTADGTKITGSGNTAQSGTSALQFVALGTAVTLSPGRYYLGFSSSGSTALAFSPAAAVAISLRNMSVMQQATANPLPATATFAACTNALLPFCGFTRTASGF